MSEQKGPQAASNGQATAAQGRNEAAQGRKKDCIPITASTAQFHVLTFKRDRPEDYAHIAEVARQIRAEGGRLSIARVFDRMRDAHMTIGGGPFKLNNSLRAAFARQLMRDFPDLDGAFETRRAACDDVPAD